MSSQKTMFALLAGAALGAVAGVLLAPASGEKTRSKLKGKAGDIRDQLTGLMDKGNSLMNDTKGEASRTVKHTMDEAKSSFDHVKSTASKA